MVLCAGAFNSPRPNAAGIGPGEHLKSMVLKWCWTKKPLGAVCKIILIMSLAGN